MVCKTFESRLIAVAAAAAVGTMPFAIGCDRDVDSVEDVTDKIGDAVDDAGDAIDDAVDDTADAVDDAADTAADAVDDATDGKPGDG